MKSCAYEGKRIGDGYKYVGILLNVLMAIMIASFVGNLAYYLVHVANMSVAAHCLFIFVLTGTGVVIGRNCARSSQRLMKRFLREPLPALERQRSYLVRTLEEKLRGSRQCGYRKPGITLPRQLAHLRIETLPDSVRREELEELEALDGLIADLQAARNAAAP